MKQMMYFPRAADGKERGFTLTEIAIVLGVVGIIVGGIWAAADNVSETRKENDAVAELQTIAHNMMTLMGGRTIPPPPTDNDITAAMITANVIPSYYTDQIATAAADNPWDNGIATVHANRGFIIYRIGPTTFRLSFYNTTYGGCIALILAATACPFGQPECPVDVVPNDGGSGIYGPGTTNLPGTWTSWAGMTASEASTLCAMNPTNGGSIEFDYATQ
ncbi:MAG: prepilin-type N-terminal cleavage/methylation domain-containing protein [Alphaproteobacteria bacterium]|nr:prepilin-type N-terminal cleavage/methylation domain-containing protein [Alphaproteobacteria bacterium]